jgi:hypothetical protein
MLRNLAAHRGDRHLEATRRFRKTVGFDDHSYDRGHGSCPRGVPL